jgi:tight adherence protein C
MDPKLLMIVTFFGATMIGLFILLNRALEKRRVYRTLQSAHAFDLQPEIQGVGLHQKTLAQAASRRLLMPGVLRLGRFLRKRTPLATVERIERALLWAGSPDKWSAERVLAFKVIGAAALPILWLLLGLGGSGFRMLSTIGFAYFGYKLPDLLLKSKYQKRQELIRRRLADTLDLLAITVEAGLGFDQALSRVSDQVGGPLGEEFHRVVREMQLGKGRADALRGFGDRSNVPEVKSFVVSMVQADVFGISIARVLQLQSKELRLRRRQTAEERAQKIPVKIVFPLLFCIFPALFVVLLGPAALRIYDALIR